MGQELELLKGLGLEYPRVAPGFRVQKPVSVPAGLSSGPRCITRTGFFLSQEPGPGG